MELIIFITLLALGYTFGQIAEKRHYKSIFAREKQLLRIPALTIKTMPREGMPVKGDLVTGSVVISIDYFKRFLAGLRNLFGGRIKSYETLLDRARREAILRMKEQAAEKGALVIMNVRLETASISKGNNKRNKIGSVEVLAYGTALSVNK
ncbi:MAG: YbjQ family protein [Gammaproteobacteria bacterium]|nr:YbjQ family protein [Gammaproteobacteria bacterium]MDH5593417.1 YbjQ family protein [Gammaproteobacteria bacterium]